jgi:hypothetical protein
MTHHARMRSPDEGRRIRLGARITGIIVLAGSLLSACATLPHDCGGGVDTGTSTCMERSTR